MNKLLLTLTTALLLLTPGCSKAETDDELTIEEKCQKIPVKTLNREVGSATRAISQVLSCIYLDKAEPLFATQ